MTNKILVVDDEPDFCEAFGKFLVPGPGECPGKLVFQGRGHCNVKRIGRFDYPRKYELWPSNRKVHISPEIAPGHPQLP